MSGKGGYKAMGLLRLSAQIAALILTVRYSFFVIKSMGLPIWAFFVSIAMLGVFFCSWTCPLGAVQEWLRCIGKHEIGWTLRVPARIDRYLSLSRYILYPVIVWSGIAGLDLRFAFMTTLAGRAIETAAYGALGALLMLSLFMDRPFCRYFCSFGALAGALSILRVVAIKRDAEKCVSCGKCDQSCQMGVIVSKARAVRDPACINCGKCLAACPKADALKPGIALPGFNARPMQQKFQ